jgi:hypothetical protein
MLQGEQHAAAALVSPGSSSVPPVYLTVAEANLRLRIAQVVPQWPANIPATHAKDFAMESQLRVCVYMCVCVRARVCDVTD